MGIEIVLDMAVSAMADRVAVGRRDSGLTYRQLDDMAAGGAGLLRDRGVEHLVFVGVNGPIIPVLMFAAAKAGIPLAPINYRLPSDQMRALIAQLDRPMIVTDSAYRADLEGASEHVLTSDEFVATARGAGRVDHPPAPDDGTAIVLFTSGTTSAPKGVLLRHHQLSAYLFNTVEFGAAGDEEAMLISTPPYHIAGMGAVLSNLYAGRRIVYLPDFTAADWLATVREERITNAMVVPTMLARIVEYLDGEPARVPTLASLAYGGARLPQSVLERALRAFPDTGFINAYGLTETSSTIAVLGPEEHRDAMSDSQLRHRLSSAGRIVPGVEVQIRDEDGTTVLPEGETGLLWVRGAQVSGEYLGSGSVLDGAGWFPTRDRARIEDGFLYIGGRADDTIIRGGENISPAEIEDVLVHHDGVREVAVVGLPDEEWGERICAVIVPVDGSHAEPDQVREWCHARLRGSRTPDEVVFVDDLPKNATGKVLRRDIVEKLTEGVAMSG
ncbi:AMP-binding protein [Mycolicibacterium thermoresistibile]